MNRSMRVISWLKPLAGPASSAVITLVIGLLIGVWMAKPPADTVGQSAPPSPTKSADKNDVPPPSAEASGGVATQWTCSMHPQIKLPKAGGCPICNMDLIPLKVRPNGTSGLRVEMTEAARAAAHIETTKVARKAVTVPIRMVGKVTYDETRVARITAWFGGRIERTYVDFTGTRVRKGDHLVSIYSPELLVAQAELIQASKDARRAPAGPLGEAARAMQRAARDKLRLWGLMDWQVRQIIRRGRAIERVTIYAPMGGVVVHKNALEGAWVKTGTPLYTIADLTHVWVLLDAYENDLAWLRYDQPTRFEVAAFPGERFDGRIAFLNPTMSARTRTVKVRVDVENLDLRLKPEMFVRAQVDVSVGAGQGPTQRDLAGKHICPMHPSEVAEKPGRCSICGMKLVTAESHWLVGASPIATDQEVPLVIPATAPLFTGKRVVVFVSVPNAQEPTYLVREVQLGARAGDHYLVRKGLKAGEFVVSRGAFRLDSSMQILGEPSVMNHPVIEEAEPTKPSKSQLARRVVQRIVSLERALQRKRARAVSVESAALIKATAALPGARGLDQATVWVHKSPPDLAQTKRALADVIRIAHLTVRGGKRLTPAPLPKDPKFAARFRLALRHALAISAALAADAPDQARAAGVLLVPAAKALVQGKRPVNPALLTGAVAISKTDSNLATQRAGFEWVNIALIPLTVLHADLIEDRYEQVWCPMALDGKGAPWLQAPGEVANPYFGASMLMCGGKVGGNVSTKPAASQPADGSKSDPAHKPKNSEEHDHTKRGGQ